MPSLAQVAPGRVAGNAGAGGEARRARSSTIRRSRSRKAGFFATASTPISMSCGSASREGKNWIAELQEREIAATGIKSLKVRFNSVFGYFIEITKSNLASVPAHYIAQANDRRRRALHHAGAEGDGGADPRRGRAGAAARVPALPDACAMRRCAISRRSSKRRRRSARSMSSARSPRRRGSLVTPAACSIDRLRLVIKRRPPSGARSESRGGKVRAERHRRSTANGCGSPSSPGRTWPANRPTSGRSR